MSEAWATHTVCITCYLDLNPDAQSDHDLVVPTITEPVECCQCGNVVSEAILMRAAVADMPHCTMPEIGARG
jgi:hypothetical protein